MNLEKMLQNPLPIDRVAARAVYGKSEQWIPMQRQNEPYWDTPPAMRPITNQMRLTPSFVDLTGVRVGRLMAIGLAENRSKNGKDSARWVMRCVCASFVVRSAKAIKRAANEDDACPRCNAKKLASSRGKWVYSGGSI